MLHEEMKRQRDVSKYVRKYLLACIICLTTSSCRLLTFFLCVKSYQMYVCHAISRDRY